MEIDILIDKEFKGSVEVNWLRHLAEQVLITQNFSSGVELGLVITSQEMVRELNRRYRGKDEPTDVLAFSMLPAEVTTEAQSPPFAQPPDGIFHLGEVIISFPQAAAGAEEHKHPVNKELAILIIHGILHLLGYEHDEPEREHRMRAREVEILNLTGLE